MEASLFVLFGLRVHPPHEDNNEPYLPSLGRSHPSATISLSARLESLLKIFNNGHRIIRS